MFLALFAVGLWLNQYQYSIYNLLYIHAWFITSPSCISFAVGGLQQTYEETSSISVFMDSTSLLSDWIKDLVYFFKKLIKICTLNKFEHTEVLGIMVGNKKLGMVS